MISRHKTRNVWESKGLIRKKIIIKNCIAGFHDGDDLPTIKCNFGRKKKVKNKDKHTCKKKKSETTKFNEY